MTVTCLTLSIKALPLIRVHVYGMLSCVRKKVSDRGEEDGGETCEKEECVCLPLPDAAGS